MLLMFLSQSLNATHASVPDISTYSFLYTQNNKDSTRSLFAARIGATGIERLKLDQQPYATYPWTDVLCLCRKTLFALNYSGLTSLDLETGQTTRLICDVLPRYEQLSCVDNRVYGVGRHNESPKKVVVLDFDRLAYSTGPAPRLVMNAPGLTSDYSVNLKARTLVEDTIMGSPYRLRQGRLLFKTMALGHARRHQVNVDPTGTRIVWLQNKDLYYHDATQAGALRVAQGCDIRGVTWINPNACASDLSRTPLPDGWTRFEHVGFSQE